MKFYELFKDCVELAKAGYGPKDVRELLEYCNTDPTAESADVSEEVKAIKETKEKEVEEEDINAFQKLVEKYKEDD